MIVNFELEALAADAQADISKLAFGTDGTATEAGDTALGAQAGSIDATVTRSGAVVTVSGTWTNSTGSTQTIREYGLLDGSNNLLARIAVNDADGGAAIIREVPDSEELTVDAWAVTAKDG